MARFMPNAKISDVHGQTMNIKGRLIVAMYHPAAALHQRSLQATVEQDFARLPELIAKADQLPEYSDPSSNNHEEDNGATQLSLF